MHPLPPVSAPPYTSTPEPPAPEHQPSLENLLLRFGLVTLDQLGSAMREQAESGTPFAEVLVRDGILRADDLARVLERAPAIEPASRTTEPESEPVALEPDPQPEPEPVMPLAAFVPDPLEPEPEPAPLPVVVGYVVRGRLVNGEEIEIASVDDAATAQQIARDAMRACARPDGSDWPVLSGRYVRPESIVSIEVAEALG